MLREFVNDRLASPIELADMARLVHRSRFHFARLFRASTGVPPHEFVIRARVDRARDLLRGVCGDRSVAEVAREVGFCSSSHMTRHFVRLVGVTPSVWARGR
jgi:AraC family transcriptional regulator